MLTKVGGIDAACYQDSGLTIPLPNPITGNSRGRFKRLAPIVPAILDAKCDPRLHDVRCQWQSVKTGELCQRHAALTAPMLEVGDNSAGPNLNVGELAPNPL